MTLALKPRAFGDLPIIFVADPLDGRHMAVPIATRVSVDYADLEWKLAVGSRRLALDWEGPSPSDEEDLTDALLDRPVPFLAAGRAATGCLKAFLRLIRVDRIGETDDANVRYPTAEETAEFALEWGVLGFCEDGLPGTKDGRLPPCAEGDDPSWRREPLDGWEVHVSSTRGILDVAHALQTGTSTRLAWQLVGGSATGGWFGPLWVELADQLSRAPAEDQWDHVASLVTKHWFDKAGLVFVMHWDQVKRRLVPTVRLGRSGGKGDGDLSLSESGPFSHFNWSAQSSAEVPTAPLFSVIAIQLAQALMSPMSKCSSCDGPIVTIEDARAPRADRQNFCGQECRAEYRAKYDREKAQRRRNRKKGLPV